jgi:hypothetical protein
MSEKITADPALLEKLKAANGHPVKLCDEAGNVVALALTTEQLRRYEIELAKARLRKEDIDRILAAPGGHSMDDVFKLLEQS